MFFCPFCPKTFSRKNNLSRHKLLHTEKKSFICTSCPKAFFRRQDLTRHFKVHSGEKAFSCRVCSKAFSRKDSLTLHFRTHNGTKPFKCNHCTGRFSQKSSLTKHLRRHTDATLFRCSFCLKDLSRRDDCARHQRSHSVAEEKPPIIEGFLEKRYGEARTQLAQGGQEEKQLQANIEFFECKKELLFMALFDDFKDNRAFKTVKGDWMVSTQRGRSRLVKANRLGDVTEFLTSKLLLGM